MTNVGAMLKKMKINMFASFDLKKKKKRAIQPENNHSHFVDIGEKIEKKKGCFRMKITLFI